MLNTSNKNNGGGVGSTMGRNIVLIGMPGSGKTTLASIFAKRYHYNPIDTDSEVERVARKSISKIFSIHGEKYFRLLEHSVIKEIPVNKNLIISVGGGAVTYKKNRVLIKNLGLVVYLFCRPGKVYTNLILDKNNPRPLIRNSPNPIRAIKELYTKRYFLYMNTCDCILKNSDLSLDELARKLFFWYLMYDS